MDILLNGPLYDPNNGLDVARTALTDRSRHDQVEQVERLFGKRRGVTRSVRRDVEDGAVQRIQLAVREGDEKDGEDLLQSGVRVIQRRYHLCVIVTHHCHSERLQLVPRGELTPLLSDRLHHRHHLLRNGLTLVLCVVAHTRAVETPAVPRLAHEESRKGLLVLEEESDFVQHLIQRVQLLVLGARLTRHVLLEHALAVRLQRLEVPHGVVVGEDERALKVTERR